MSITRTETIGNWELFIYSDCAEISEEYWFDESIEPYGEGRTAFGGTAELTNDLGDKITFYYDIFGIITPTAQDSEEMYFDLPDYSLDVEVGNELYLDMLRTSISESEAMEVLEDNRKEIVDYLCEVASSTAVSYGYII